MTGSKPEDAPEPVTKITDHMHPLDAWSAESRALIHRLDLEDAQSQESEMTGSKPEKTPEELCKWLDELESGYTWNDPVPAIAFGEAVEMIKWLVEQNAILTQAAGYPNTKSQVSKAELSPKSARPRVVSPQRPI